MAQVDAVGSISEKQGDWGLHLFQPRQRGDDQQTGQPPVEHPHPATVVAVHGGGFSEGGPDKGRGAEDEKRGRGASNGGVVVDLGRHHAEGEFQQDRRGRSRQGGQRHRHQQRQEIALTKRQQARGENQVEQRLVFQCPARHDEGERVARRMRDKAQRGQHLHRVEIDAAELRRADEQDGAPSQRDEPVERHDPDHPFSQEIPRPAMGAVLHIDHDEAGEHKEQIDPCRAPVVEEGVDSRSRDAAGIVHGDVEHHHDNRGKGPDILQVQDHFGFLSASAVHAASTSSR